MLWWPEVITLAALLGNLGCLIYNVVVIRRWHRLNALLEMICIRAFLMRRHIPVENLLTPERTSSPKAKRRP